MDSKVWNLRATESNKSGGLLDKTASEAIAKLLAKLLGEFLGKCFSLKDAVGGCS